MHAHTQHAHIYTRNLLEKKKKSRKKGTWRHLVGDIHTRCVTGFHAPGANGRHGGFPGADRVGQFETSKKTIKSSALALWRRKGKLPAII